jgi:predicted dehydrogenase
MEVAAVYEPEEKRRQWLDTLSLDGVVCSSEERFWESGPFDLVVVTAPPEFHCQYSCQAFENGASVLVEKPMALSVADGRRMLAVVDGMGKKIWVGFQRRFRDVFVAMKHELGEEPIKDLVSVQYEMLLNPRGWQPLTDFLCDDSRGGGVLDDVVSHQANLLSWLFKSRIEKVRVVSSRETVHPRIIFEIEFVLGSGLKIRCIAGHADKYCERITARFQHRLLIAEPASLMRCEKENARWAAIYGKVASIWHNLISKATGRPNRTTVSMIRQLQAVGAELHGGSCQQRATSGEEGMVNILVIDACRRSLQANGEMMHVVYNRK